MDQRKIIIGDVHGCPTELRDLLSVAEAEPGDTVVFVGDLVSKGPDSHGVVRYVRGLRACGLEVVLVRGNHEDKLIRFAAHEAKRMSTGQQNPMRDPDGQLLRLMMELDADDLQFLSESTLFYKLTSEYGGGFTVHGGLDATIDALPDEPPSPELHPKQFRKLSSVMRTRCLDGGGRSVRLTDVKEGDVFWAEAYDGRVGHVYFGHQTFMGADARRFPHATGIDLGAVYGGHLAAVVLRPGKPQEVITVPAREIYCRLKTR